MTDTFPKHPPEGFRLVLVPGVPPKYHAYDPGDQPILAEALPEREKAVAACWKKALDFLGYAGVSTLVCDLQAQVEDLRKAMAAQQETYQSELVESLENEKVTDDTSKAQIEALKKKLEATEKELKEVSEMSEKRRVVVEKFLEFKEAMSKASIHKVGTEWELKKLIKLPEKKPVHPAWDFGGAIPNEPPEGYKLEDRGAGKPLRFLLTGPDGLSTPCFDKDTALEKAWKTVRAANKIKADKGESAPEFTPKKPPGLPPGFSETFDGSGHRPYKLKLPDNSYRYFSTPQELNTRAWEIHREHEAKGRSWSSQATSSSTTSTTTTDPMHQTQPPPGYSFVFMQGKEAEFRLWLNGNGAQRQHVDFISRRARLVAAWKHKMAPLGDKMTSIRGMERFPNNWEGSVPDGYGKLYSNTNGKKRYGLRKPDNKIAYFESNAERSHAAWEHWRLAITDSGRKDPPKPKALTEAKHDEDFPLGYQYSYMGMSLEKPHRVKMSGGEHQFFKNRDEAIKAAKAHQDADNKVKPAPEGYVICIKPSESPGYSVKSPTGQIVYQGFSKQVASKRAWEHYDKTYSDKPKSAALLPTAGSNSAPDEFETLPPGYKHEVVDGNKPWEHKVSCEGWFDTFAIKAFAFGAAWDHYKRHRVENLPPHFKYTFNADWKLKHQISCSVGDARVGLEKACATKQEAYTHAWAHHDKFNAKVKAPDSFKLPDEEKELPPGMTYEFSTGIARTHVVKYVFEAFTGSVSSPTKQGAYKSAWRIYYKAHPDQAKLRDTYVDRETHLPLGYKLSMRPSLTPPYKVSKGEWCAERQTEGLAYQAAWERYDRDQQAIAKAELDADNPDNLQEFDLDKLLFI